MEWVTGIVVVLLVAVTMGALALLARRVRRRGSAGQALAAAMAAFDEGFHSTAHDTFVETKIQDERGQQAPTPGRPGGGSGHRKDLP
jgi:hypothetical protein